jgi:radical SAM superfamily enzyme YgiQ (UPF0313 family)
MNSSKENIDIVFATVPYTDTDMPLMAPAILKSIASRAGHTSICIDLNLQTLKLVKKHPYVYELLNFFHDGITTANIEQEVYELHLSFAKNLLVHNPKIIGLSVFTYNCQVSAKYISYFIKKLSPSTKIILGGNGLMENLVGKSKFAIPLVDSGLIDFYIRGDGEHVLYEYLTNADNISGINSSTWHQLSNEELTALPAPDYDDYDMNEYSVKLLPILGSRGCVRQCTFCDIHAHWTKFSYRSGQHVFNEMLDLSIRYGIYSFKFQDSLNNGNLKEYRQLMKLIADYNNSCDPIKKFNWTSFFILRPKKDFTEEDWKLTAQGGAAVLLVGIETLSDYSRFHLGKKFTNDDIEFSLQMAKKYGIKMVLLFLIGYITETEDDIDYAVKWWEDHTEYKDTIRVNLGSPLGILRETPLEKRFIELKLERVGPNDQDWVNPETGNTPVNRVKWYNRLSATIARLGYTEVKPVDNHYIMEKIMKDFT